MTAAPDYTVQQVLDLDRVRGLLEAVHAANGDTLAVTDLRGQLLVAVGFQDVCTRFYRGHPTTEARCTAASVAITERLLDQPYTMYECPNGIIDIAFPILVGGQCVGAFWTGQLFLHDPDWESFVRQARELGFDPEAFLAALRRVPVRPRAQVERSIAFYQNLVGFISDVGVRKLEQDRAYAELTRQVELVQQQRETLELQTQAILELSTPVIQVWDDILVLPLIGTIDTARAQQIMENLLEAVVTARAAVVIIDITGVPMVDTKVAHHLLNTIDATRLLGAEAVVTGVSPHNAQTLVRLGVDLSRVATRSTLQSGLELAFARTGRQVKAT